MAARLPGLRRQDKRAAVLRLTQKPNNRCKRAFCAHARSVPARREVIHVNEQMQRVQRPGGTTWEQKKNAGVWLASFPATTAQLLTRRKTGFRLLKPVKVVGLALVMAGVGVITPTGDSGRGGDMLPAPAVVLPQSNIPAGVSAPLPPDWARMNYGARMAWLNAHRLTPEQQREREQREQRERERLQAEARAKAESAARWAKFKAGFARWPMFAFAFVFLVVGLYQRRARWKGLLNGEKWHTRSRGVPYLNKLLGRVMPETWIMRFADPLAVFIAGLFALVFTRALGLWLIVSAFALYIVEQAVYEQALDRILDILDNLIDADADYCAVTVFRNGGKSGEVTTAKSVEENGGVLSTSAMIPDALRRREERDGQALRNLTREAELVAEVDRTLAKDARQSSGKANGQNQGGGLAASDDRL